jgi:hypothetical protein
MCLPFEQYHCPDFAPSGRVLESQRMRAEAAVGFPDRRRRRWGWRACVRGKAVRGAAGDLDAECSLPGRGLTSKDALVDGEPDPATLRAAACARARRRARAEFADRRWKEES